MLFDGNKFKELDANVESVDILNFKDTKAYTDRLKEVKGKTKLTDSIEMLLESKRIGNGSFLYGLLFYRRFIRFCNGRKNQPSYRLCMKHKFLYDYLSVWRSKNAGSSLFSDAVGKSSG
jgi:hypothetical protein